MTRHDRGRVLGKAAVVTGGAAGIGRSIVELLARQGASVAVFDVDESAGTTLVNELDADGVRASYHQVDVTDEESIRFAFTEVEERFGALHILVNNAGISGPGEPPDQVDYAQWQRMIAVNVAGPFLCTKHAIPLMRRSEGGKSIVDISSIYGLVGNADSPSYHAAKGAVRMMAKTDAIVYAPEGIRVNAVCPGSILTPLNLAKGEEDPGYLDAMRAKHPLGVIGDPEDIAYGVLYLASDEAKFVTGTELVIDGGYTAQ
ncbi:SDR family NAD(P)-dependent oxidoreductase [Rhodococcus gannanensis]|uniref:SDR family NAD(P)-dependent oxidoreductase n=1 Tax=Rhodococcus gannanensis TaxID=1960308 RepID=A0ABW4NZK0_9NOCA